MRKYRHRQSGAIFETEREMPQRDWELISPAAQDTDPKPQRRKTARKKTTPKE